MKIQVTEEFKRKVERQIRFISYDKPIAAKNLNKLFLSEISKLKYMPFKCKISKFFDDENIRDLVVKGYSIVYRIEKENNKIIVFGFHKWEEFLKE